MVLSHVKSWDSKHEHKIYEYKGHNHDDNIPDNDEAIGTL